MNMKINVTSKFVCKVLYIYIYIYCRKIGNILITVLRKNMYLCKLIFLKQLLKICRFTRKNKR